MTQYELCYLVNIKSYITFIHLFQFLIKINDLSKSYIHKLFFSHLFYNNSRLVAGLRQIVNLVSSVDFLEMRK